MPQATPARAGKFWIIDTGSSGEHAESRDAIGPFPSIAPAKAYLVRDAIETFATSDERICDAVPRTDRKWASPVHIVRVLTTLEQVPTVTIGCDLLQPQSPRT